ncbi:hypothetical protein H0E87_010715, partial [Populus deltoides]
WMVKAKLTIEVESDCAFELSNGKWEAWLGFCFSFARPGPNPCLLFFILLHHP